MTKHLVLVILLVVAGFVTFLVLRARAAPEGQAPSTLNQSEIEARGKEAVERAKRDIERFGWHWVAVPGEGGSPGFLFTIGLWKTYHHPELLLFAPGDPQELSGGLTAMAKRIAAGETFSDKKTFEGLFGNFPGSLRRVDKSWYAEFVGTAMGVYESDDFPVLQVVWPDKNSLFPWQPGFDGDLFRVQPLLYETNLVLANVSQEERQRRVEEEGPQVLRASWAELFVELPAEQRDSALADWRWLVGPDAKLFRVTVFGDLLLQRPDGHISWLDTGSAVYEEFADSEAEALELVAINLPAFFHVSTLLALRDLGFRPQAGQVYSWRQAPLLGGEEKVENVDRVPAIVHISHAGRLARALESPASGTAAELSTASGADENPARRHQVVINEEGQYSMWPEGEKIPDGWKSVGKTGTKQECLDYIKAVWIDMRPLSLRKAIEAQEKGSPPENQ